MNQIQEMIAAGAKCKAEYSHRATGGQVYDDLPVSCLSRKTGKPEGKRAEALIAAWWKGFNGEK